MCLRASRSFVWHPLSEGCKLIGSPRQVPGVTCSVMVRAWDLQWTGCYFDSRLCAAQPPI